MTVNITPPIQTQVLIGNDNQDWSATFLEFTIGDPERGIDGLLMTRGKLVLALTLDAPESMNPRGTTGRLRFRRGQRVIINITDSTGTLRRHPRGWAYIAETPLPPFPPENTMEIDLVCGLDLQRFPQPAGLIASPQISYGPTPSSQVTIGGLDRNGLITKLLQQAGCPCAIGVAVGQYPYKEPFFTDPGPDGRTDYAGKVAYGGTETLYQDNQGVIRSTGLRLRTDNPIATIIIGQDEAKYEPIKGGETPVEKVIYEGTVTGIKGADPGKDEPPDPEDKSNYSTSYEYGPAETIADDIGSGQLIIRKTSKIDGKIANGKFSITEVEEPLGLISSVAYPKVTSLGVSSRIRIEHRYDPNDGKLLTVTTTETQPFIKLCATYWSALTEDEQAGYLSTMVTITNVERHEYDGKLREIRITTTEQKPIAAIDRLIETEGVTSITNPLDPKHTKIEVQEWREIRKDEWERTTIIRQPTIVAKPDTVFNSPNANDRVTAKLALQTTNFTIESSTAGQVTPNATETAALVIETEPKPISASATFNVTNLGFSPRERTYKLETACSGGAQLQELAQIQGAVLIGRGLGARIQLPFLDAFIDNPRPLQTIAVIETEQLGTGWRQNLIFYQLDAMEFSHNGEEAIVTAALIWLGTREGAIVSYDQIPVTPAFEPAAISAPYETLEIDYVGTVSEPEITESPVISILPPQTLIISADMGIGFGMDADSEPGSLAISVVAEMGIGFGMEAYSNQPIIAEMGLGFGMEATITRGDVLATLGLGFGMEAAIASTVIATLGLGFGMDVQSVSQAFADMGLGFGMEAEAIAEIPADMGLGFGMSADPGFAPTTLADMGLGFGLEAIINAEIAAEMGIGFGMDASTDSNVIATLGLGFGMETKYAFQSSNAETLIGRTSGTYSDTRLAAIDTFWLALESAGLVPTIDALYILAAPNSSDAALNWKSSSYTITVVGSPTFTTDRGYGTNWSSTTYLSTGFTPSTNGASGGGNYAQDSATIGVYSRTNANAVNRCDIGVNLTNVAELYTRENSLSYARLNHGTAFSSFTNNTSSLGWFTACRTASNLITLYRNGSSLGTASNTSTGLPTGAIVIGASRTGASSVNNASNRQLAAAVIASGWTAQNNLDFYNALNTYLTAIGANV